MREIRGEFSCDKATITLLVIQYDCRVVRLAQWAGIVTQMASNVKPRWAGFSYWMGDHLVITIAVCSKSSLRFPSIRGG